MKICGRDYRVYLRPSEYGAGFSAIRRNVWIGARGDLKDMGAYLIHEATEAILYEDGKRLTPNLPHIIELYDDNSRYIFHFDHDYLIGFANKFQDALLTSGFFKLCDPRKKK